MYKTENICSLQYKIHVLEFIQSYCANYESQTVITINLSYIVLIGSVNY